MAKIIPFNGIRYRGAYEKNLSGLICPPYDVINKQQRKSLTDSAATNFVNIELPVSDASSKKHLQSWLKKGVLAKEKTPALYFYQQEFSLAGKKFKRTGFFAGLELDEKYIHKHEKTIQKHIDHRFELLKTVKVNTSPIFCLFPDKTKTITNFILNTVKKNKPITFKDPDGIINRLWVVTDKAVISELAEKIKKTALVIADGHHRCRTGMLYRDLIESGPSCSDSRGSKIGNRKQKLKNKNQNYKYILSFFCSIEDPGLVVLPTHRVIKAYPDIKEKLANNFTLSPWNGKSKPQIVCYHNGEFSTLTLKDKTFAKKNKLEAEISAIVLNEFLLSAINPENIFFTKDIGEAVKKAHEIEGYAFLLEPPNVNTVFELSQKGKVMPQKTTYFYPKVPAGLVIYSLED
ncbi:MAG: hypothetical protein A2252_04295 [Elusimicrobia bacterium RIFOXYA2_FULL_39_19]|nr:MAG: hypothetical protein A2252_04295 [Elusimicrobia bacterium RIFOXYA2_FULL_39_19]